MGEELYDKLKLLDDKTRKELLDFLNRLEEILKQEYKNAKRKDAPFLQVYITSMLQSLREIKTRLK